MGQGSITRKASDLRPLLLDRFRNAAAAYSLRPLTLSGQDNPVVKVRRSVDNTEQDFNPAQINDGTLEQFVNAGDVAPADYGTGAAAAYSLRHVSDGYTGDVVRVRRSVDNTEQDFNPTEIEDGTLLAWVGTSGTDNGFVTTWYDQSGNSNDATQATAASQPKIVSGGSLVTENGKPAIDFDGVNDHLFTGITDNYTNNYSEIVVAKSTNTDPVSVLLSHDYTVTTGGYLGTRTNGANWGTFDVSEKIFGATSGNLDLVTRFGNGFTISNFVNNVAGAVYSSLTKTIPNLIGAFNTTTSFFSGFISELLIYPDDQSSNRELIETNVNHYYSIYSQTNDGFVTTWYDQSGNGNDATQATASSQPKIVSAGALVTENGKAALDFDGIDDFISSPVSLEPSVTSFAVSKIVSEADFNFIYDTNTVNSGGRIRLGLWNDNSYFSDNDEAQNATSTILSDGSQHKFYARHTNALVDISVDGEAVVSLASSNFNSAVTSFIIGARSDSLDHFLDGTIQELTIYNSDQSTKRQQIESNINTYYGIY